MVLGEETGDGADRNEAHVYLPISVPIPNTDPRIAINAPSPPVLPPGLSVRLCGFVVTPYMLLVVSIAWRYSRHISSPKYTF